MRRTLEELAKLRDELTLAAAVESTIESLEVADRERSGRVMVSLRGRLARKQKCFDKCGQTIDPVPASQDTNAWSGVSVSKKVYDGKPALEIQVRDELIKAGVWPVRVVKRTVAVSEAE